MKKTSHVGESVTSAALRLSPRQLHNLLTQMPLENFAIAFNQGLNLQKRYHRVSLVVKVTVDRSSSRCGMHATKTLELELIELRTVEAQVSTWFSWFNLAGGGHFELPHARALQAAAAELKEPDKVQATVGASSA